MIKSFQKVGIEEAYINIIKAICDKPTVNIILINEKMKSLPLNQEQDKDAQSCCFYSTQYYKSQSQK